MKYTQYILVDEQGEKAYITHQDDTETPLGCGSLRGLIGQIAEWLDTSIGDVQNKLEASTGQLIPYDDDEDNIWYIKKEVIDEQELDKDDLLELYQLANS